MEGATNHVPKSLNPYVKIYTMDIETHKALKNQIKKHDNVEMENQSNHVIEDTQTLQVVLTRIKIYECDTCCLCYTSLRDYRLHLLKHAKPVVHTEFSSEKYGNYVKRFKCEDCDKRFVAASTLHAHLVVHLPFPHICHCGIGFNKKDDLKAHKQLVHPEIIEKSWQPRTSYVGKIEKSKFCIKSEYVTPQTKAIKTKLGVYKPKEKIKEDVVPVKPPRKKFEGKKPFECPTCHKLYSSSKSLEVHSVTHTGVKPFKCDVCDKNFSQVGALNIHKLRHSGVTFECPVCKKKLGQKAALTLHMRKHTGEKPYHCDICEKRFSDPSAFARHVRTHTGDKRYRCAECPMRFTDASGLIAHRKRHTGQRDYKCEICEKKFYFASVLRTHVIAVHVRKYIYQCDYCGKKFTTKNYLKSHIENTGVHTGFKCKLCPRVFYDEYKRDKHMKIHKKHAFDDYECHHCGVMFATRKTILKHLREEHVLV